MTRMAWSVGVALAFAAHSVAAQTTSVRGTVISPEGPEARAVVYLLPQARPAAPPRVVSESLMIDQRDLRFVPRVLAVTPGSTVQFLNSDPVMHNVFSPTRGAAFNLGTFPTSDRRPYTFPDTGVFAILCHVHPEMLAYVVVVPSALRAVSDDSGRFVISDVPPGRYDLMGWDRRFDAHPATLVVGADGTADVVLRLHQGGSRRRGGGR